MDTTVDLKSIGKLIHVGCKHHHCRRKHAKDSTSECAQGPAATPEVGEEWPPECSHCGIRPPPQQPSASESETKMPVRRKVKATKQKAPVGVYPDNIPDIDGDGSDSDSGSDDSDDIEDDDKDATPAEPFTVGSTELSGAIDALKITTSSADKAGDQPGKDKTKAPSSVPKPVAGQGNSEGSPKRGSDTSKSPCNKLMDQEVVTKGSPSF